MAPTASWPAILIGCLGLATISMFILPRAIAYDPWSWLIWGREIDHLALNTRDAATAVKPLPIFINTLLAPTGSLAPTLWLLIARAATLLSLALAFRLGRRLGGVGAGLIAAVGLAATDQFLGYLFMRGMSEPMATAAVLAAVDNQMQSRRGWALACLVAAGLLRPEAWPFLLGYGLWISYPKSAWQRTAAVGLAVAVPAVWFVIDWFGSREFFRSAGAATRESQGGPLLSKQPGLATVRETWHLMSGPMVVLFLLGFGAALLAWITSGRARPTVWLGFGALAWLAVDAALAQGRFATGAPRYLLPGAALACVVAGVFVADVVRSLAHRMPSARTSAALVAVICVGLAVLAGPRLVTTGRQVKAGALLGREAVRTAANLDAAIALGGGRNSIVRCGTATTQRFQVPLVAWSLRVPVGTVAIVPAVPGTVLQQAGQPTIRGDVGTHFRPLGSVGVARTRWTVLTTCH
jgi:hypothetical protein